MVLLHVGLKCNPSRALHDLHQMCLLSGAKLSFELSASLSDGQGFASKKNQWCWRLYTASPHILDFNLWMDWPQAAARRGPRVRWWDVVLWDICVTDISPVLLAEGVVCPRMQQINLRSRSQGCKCNPPCRFFIQFGQATEYVAKPIPFTKAPLSRYVY